MKRPTLDQVFDVAAYAFLIAAIVAGWFNHLWWTLGLGAVSIAFHTQSALIRRERGDE